MNQRNCCEENVQAQGLGKIFQLWALKCGTCLGFPEKLLKSSFKASSETQGQLVGTTGFSWAKVYNKSGRAPGHLLLPIQFQKRLNSLLLIGQKNISEEEQPGDSHVFLHEVVFLINRRSSVARSTGTFLRRASEKKK